MASDEQPVVAGGPGDADDAIVHLGPATEEGAKLGVRFDAEEHDTRARQRIAYWLLAILSVGLGLPLLAWIFGKPANEVVDVSTKVLAPIVGLLGTVLGFYFASRRK